MKNPLLYVAIALIASCGLLMRVKYQDDITLSWHLVMSPLWLPIAVMGLFIAIVSLLQSIQFFFQKRKAHGQIIEKEKNKTEKTYFTGDELARAYFYGRRDFRGIVLTGSGFSGESKTDFSFADFSDSDFGGHRLGVSFHKSKLTNCNFKGANLSGIYAGGADFTGSNFTDCDLSESYLDGAIFDNCNLTNANFYGSQWFRKASFKNAIFNNTLMPNQTR